MVYDRDDAFATEARRRIKEFLDKAGYSAHGTVVATSNFVELVLGIKEPDPEPQPEPVVKSEEYYPPEQEGFLQDDE